ncbi:TolC family protein [Carboxylicivirga sp. N1Y90]|uniref:TolC family protein n=1 Tax=Carboxylicivirga fragile TaxID=3417571 RepID=UPI003D342E56|nr:TolC family protein [Marinilabiliaceae bacterium N1Y90]
MRQIVSTLMLLIALSTNAQVLSLDECLSLSRANYPLIADFENLNKQLELKLKSLNANYYPKLDLTGQFTWQNDVPGFDSPMPGMDIPKAPQEQYKAFVDVQQVIYDGGITKAAKVSEQRQKAAEKYGVEVQLFAVRDKVVQSYFMVLMFKEQLAQLDYRRLMLEERFREIKSAVDNGMVLQSEADLLYVEMVQLDQDKFALLEGRASALDILSELTGKEISEEAALEMPLLAQEPNFYRPEYDLFAAQQEQLGAYKALAGRSRMPVVAGFGQVGYGNPGYNMLKDEFATFYMVGLRLKWNIWDWKSSANEKAVLSLKTESVKYQQATFTKNVSMAQSQIEASIRKLDKVIEKDDEIIRLRKGITEARQSQLNNGTITAADYIKDLNTESMARLAKELHLLELSKAKVQLNDLRIKQ